MIALIISEKWILPRSESTSCAGRQVPPGNAAQRVLNQVTAAGVKAVLNFAPASLSARLGVKVKTVDLTTSLESLSYFLARPQASSVTNARRSNNFEEAFEQKEHEI